MSVAYTKDWGPVTATQLAFYSAAAGVTDPIHFDIQFAKSIGMTDIVANGSLRVAMLEQALYEAFVKPIVIKELACRHRAPLYRGQETQITVYGNVEQDGAGARCTVTIKSGDTLIDEAEAIVAIV